MNSLVNFVNHFNDFYGGINGSTFTGAIDVIVVEQADGSFKCSPFHVRFGKLGILHSKEKIVDIIVNDVPLDFHMKLGESGEAFFVEKVDDEVEGVCNVPANLVCSPILDDLARENVIDGFASENVVKKEMILPVKEVVVKVETKDSEESPTKLAKVFRAETSEVKLSEKINSFHGEFRPIDSRKLPAENVADRSDSSSSESASGTDKVRRKKKSHLRKKSEVKISKSSDDEPKTLSSLPENEAVDTAVVDVDYHFFSDSEATPESDNAGVRVHSILSDSEVDKKSGDEAEADTSWRWGQLPTPVQKNKEQLDETPHTAAANQKEESPSSRRSMIGTMLSFMKKTKYIRHNPEVAPPEPPADKSAEDDAESGCGASLAQSPLNVDNRAEEALKSVAMSLCGHLESGPKDEDFAKSLLSYDDLVKNHKLIDDPNLVIRFDSKYYNWKTVCPIVLSALIFNRLLPQATVEELCNEYMPKKVSTYSDYWWGWGRHDKKEAKTEKVEEKQPETSVVETETKPHEVYRKVLRLTSEQISTLNLQPGQNEAVFSITSAYQGTAQCKCHIYRWRHDDRVVVSDIDGTITKSDVLGHILPILGRDWAQSGVARLFSKIKNNGYKLLYLSARAIGQATTTRDYLKSIRQAELSLPEGPVLLSPTGLLNALHREVIDKRPEDFKIPCLKDIQSLFPEGVNPFYAGYGNKVNDVWSYRAVGIPMFRIFTVNHRGELKHEFTQTFQTTYSNLSYIVDHVFPPSEYEQQLDDYSSFVYWREPLEEIVVDPITKKVVTIKTEVLTKGD